MIEKTKIKIAENCLVAAPVSDYSICVSHDEKDNDYVKVEMLSMKLKFTLDQATELGNALRYHAGKQAELKNQNKKDWNEETTSTPLEKEYIDIVNALVKAGLYHTEYDKSALPVIERLIKALSELKSD